MLDYTVNIDDNVAKRSCNVTFRSFSMLPCTKACSRDSGGANRAYFDLISAWYTTAKCTAAYASLFHPEPDRRHWDVHEGSYIHPSSVHINFGCLRSARIKGFMDQTSSSEQNRCNKCGVLGYKQKSYTC